MTEPELFDEAAVALEIVPLEVVQETASPTDHLQKTPPPMMVLVMRAEVIRERVDPPSQHRDLDPGRSGVRRMRLMLLHHRLLVKAHELCILQNARMKPRVESVICDKHVV